MKTSVVKLAMAVLAVCAVVLSCEKNPSADETPALTLGSVTEVSISADGGPASFTFTSNQDWIVSPNASWVTVDPVSGKASETPVTVNVTFDPNPDYEARTTTILIKAGDLSKEIPVTQEAAVKPTVQIPDDVVDMGFTYVAVENGVSKTYRVYWAKCNLGAEKSEDVGYYYAWGETSIKDQYNWENYRWWNGVNVVNDKAQFKKYCTNTESWGVTNDIDNKYILDSEDDAAYARKGAYWRLPTDEEFSDLIRTTKSSNADGVQFTSKTTGKSIFMPYPDLFGYTYNYDGHYDYYTPAQKPDEGFYWTCVLNKNDNKNAVYFYFTEDLNLMNLASGTPRCCGLAIRPVFVVEE